MERPSTTQEARKRLTKLREKERKLQQELEAAEQSAKEAEEFEQKAIEVGSEIIAYFEITDLKGFIRWLTSNTARITGIRNKAVSDEPSDEQTDVSSEDLEEKGE